MKIIGERYPAARRSSSLFDTASLVCVPIFRLSSPCGRAVVAKNSDVRCYFVSNILGGRDCPPPRITAISLKTPLSHRLIDLAAKDGSYAVRFEHSKFRSGELG